jgi:hypothetical protein
MASSSIMMESNITVLSASCPNTVNVIHMDKRNIHILYPLIALIKICCLLKINSSEGPTNNFYLVLYIKDLNLNVIP